MSLVSEFFPESRFASGSSIYALAQLFAQVVGPAAELYLVNAIGFSPSYFLAAGCLWWPFAVSGSYGSRIGSACATS